MNVASVLVNAAKAFPAHPAITWCGRTENYRVFSTRTAALADALQRDGVTQGDRVAVFMHNRPELLETLFATLRLGAIVVPCSARSTADELRFVLDDCGAAILLTDREHHDIAGEAAGGRMVVDADDDFDRLIDGGTSDPLRVAPVGDDDAAWLFYTSGTTGRPKGATLSHRALNFMIVSWLADLTPLDQSAVTLHAAPLSHGAGFHALVATARAAHQVILDTANFDATRTLDVIDEHRITNTWLVPTQVILLTEALTAAGRSAPSSLCQVVYGGAPMAASALERVLAAFGPVLVQLYAQGESPMTITWLPACEHVGDALASVGRPRLGVEVRLVDDEGKTVASGEVGEVAVRGPSVMSGYWRRPDATAAALVDGWLRTGDLGRFDERGLLYLLDRAKDLIISGGSNVYAAEVEAVLSDLPDITEVAVVGATDDLWGERVEAVVVLADGAQLDVAAVDRAARVRLVGYKVPRRYHVVDCLPRNAYGKVLKSELRAFVCREPLTESPISR